MPADRPEILHVFPTFATGGAQRVAAAVMAASRTRFRHTVVALDGRFEAAAGLDGVTLLDGRRFTTLAARRRLLAELAPALLVTCNWGSLEWVMAAHWPTRLLLHVHAEHGFGSDELRRRLLRRDLARALLLRRAMRVVLPSCTLLAVARRAWRLPPQRLVHIPNGVALDTPVPIRPPPAAVRCGW